MKQKQQTLSFLPLPKSTSTNSTTTINRTPPLSTTKLATLPILPSIKATPPTVYKSSQGAPALAQQDKDHINKVVAQHVAAISLDKSSNNKITLHSQLKERFELASLQQKQRLTDQLLAEIALLQLPVTTYYRPKSHDALHAAYDNLDMWYKEAKLKAFTTLPYDVVESPTQLYTQFTRSPQLMLGLAQLLQKIPKYLQLPIRTPMSEHITKLMDKLNTIKISVEIPHEDYLRPGLYHESYTTITRQWVANVRRHFILCHNPHKMVLHILRTMWWTGDAIALHNLYLAMPTLKNLYHYVQSEHQLRIVNLEAQWLKGSVVSTLPTQEDVIMTST